ncbi:hypothetical protein HPP92_005392 [Vanilla planifolia]|uniref:Uncharacterized protein n=2 Tax=Vanilla planifolia TaxID=51239 RepID=A0A835V914_VANPL|nr:hypothetical protein HPP92_005392 [Vanilla planifolia]
MQASQPTKGSLPEEPPLLQDLQVRILSSSIVHPSKPTEKRILFLSNIDQVLNFSVETVHFFVARAGYSAETVADTLRSALDRVLVPYDFLAGRLSVNHEGRLEIDCNSAGVGFVVAESGLELADLGELEYPNPAFRQLAAAGIPAEGVKMEDQPLCSFQVTSFKCGSFALGISNNHATFDGHGFKSFLDNLAALTRDGPPVISRPPFTDRSLLSVRSPPCICFRHPELVDIEMEASDASPTMLELSSCALDFKLFKLTVNDIASPSARRPPPAARPL